MKPSLGAMVRNYPRKKDVDRASLFKEIGWDDLTDNMNFENTCAIRVSIALIKSGANFPGQMPIKAGPYKGRMIETMQWKLSRALVRLLGKPEKFKTGKAEDGIGDRAGIVSFFVLHPEMNDSTGGHIDVLLPHQGIYRECGSSCYWGSKEVWFWPLK